MTSEPQPYLRDLSGDFSEVGSRHDVGEAAAIASREAMAREQALHATPRTPAVAMPPIKEACLPLDYGTSLAQLDERISRNGVLIDADRLVSLGNARFQELLALERKARSGQRIMDLTRLESVQRGIDAFEAPASDVPARSTAEQLSGAAKERDQVRKISGWSDLWKATLERQETLDDIFAFHDAFNVLLFGHSLSEQLPADGRARSPLFRGGGGENVDLFRQWLTVLKGKHVRVTLKHPFWSLVSWMADEKTPLCSLEELARDLFNVRAPTEAQIALAHAVLDGFLLDHRSWVLWEFVGRATRTSKSEEKLSAWRGQLAKRFPAISAFHTELRSAFYRNVGFGPEAHRELDSTRWRSFLDNTMQRLRRQSSALLALGLEQTFPAALVARFENWALVEGASALSDRRIQIALPLAKAFPGSTFQLEFEELQP